MASHSADPLSLPAGPAIAARRRPGLGLAAICLGFLMITLDATIVNVALGPIAADLGGSLAGAQWIVSAYTISFATLLLSAGAWADRIGSRRGYLVGLAVFAAGSALCAAAPSLAVLIAARGLQGAGAAFLMPCSLALITHSYPGAAERRRALSVWGGVSGIGLAGGPVLGGVLVGALGWRAIFVVNPPLAALVALAVLAEVSETPRHRHRFDPVGQLLAIASLGALSGGFILAGDDGWGAAPTLALLGAGALLALAFLAAERAVEHPMVAPALFRRRGFSLAVAIAGIFNFCLYGSLFCLSVALQLGRGLTPMQTGLALLPATALVGVTAFLSSRAIGRLGEWRAVMLGLAAGGAGGALMAAAARAPVAVLVLASLPLGLVALAMPAMTAIAMADAGERVGLASGVQNAAGLAGGVSLRPALLAVAAAYLLGLGLALAGRRADRHGRDAA